MSSTRTYLGRVREVRTSFGAYHYALVEPLLESDDTGNEWLGPIADVDAEFPDRGRAYWHEAPPTLQRGTLWQFQLEERPAGGGGDVPRERDRWQVFDPRLPVEIVDLRAWDEEALRVAITGSGVPLALDPIAKRVALWIDDAHLLGPVRLRRADDQRSWVLDLEDLSKIAVYRTPRTKINAVECEGARLFLEPYLDLGSQAGIRNWCPDEEIARSVLKRLAKLDRTTVEALRMTDVVFSRYVEAQTAAGFGGKDGPLDRARVARVGALRAAIASDQTLLEETATALLDTPLVASRVEAKVSARVQEQVDARAYQVEAAIAAKEGKLAEHALELERLMVRQSQVDAELASAEAELKRIDADFEREFEERAAAQDRLLAEREDHLGAAVREREEQLARLDEEYRDRSAKYESALAEHLHMLAERPESAFAKLAVMRVALGGHTSNGTSRNGTRASASPRVVVLPPLGGRCADVTTIKLLKAALGRHAVHHGLHPFSVLECHAACLASGMPIVVGDRAEDLVEAYAATVAGGRMTWVPIGASMLEPHQLLGWVDSAAHRFVPHANGLAELLLGARGSADVHVVVFDGIDRAPAEGWLLPFLHAMSAARRGRTDRGIPLVPPGSVAADDPFAAVSRLQWPRNVLPIGIPTPGTAALPLPAELWRFGALVDADRESPAGFVGVASDPVPPSRVAAEQWFAWQDEMATTNDDDVKAATSLVGHLPTGTRHLEIVGRMAAALRAHELPPGEVRRHAFIPTLVPRFAEAEDALERHGDSAGIGPATHWRTVLDAAIRLAR
jgi:hypothetical protein